VSCHVATGGRVLRGEATRRRIVDAAHDILLERGHAAASTRAVADKAGVPLSLVHYHFGGKQGLLRPTAMVPLTP
jgi:AcrR family transcriptional regulator